MTTWIYVDPVLKLGNTDAEVGLKAAVLTVFITLMVAVPDYTSLPLSLFLGTAFRLVRSNNIVPSCQAGYQYQYTLDQALEDWQHDNPEDWSI